MQRIVNPPDNMFVDGNASTGTPGTIVSAAWLNSLQEEVAAVIESEGITLDPEVSNQLLAAILQKIAAEVASRVSVDNALQVAIDAEKAARETADSSLQGNINAEAAARAGADDSLQAGIDAEAAARASADSGLQSNVNAEATARANADSAHAALTNAHGATSANAASRIVMRDGAGDVFGRLFRSEYAATQANMPYFMGQVALGAGANNYVRPMTVAQARAALGVDYGNFGRVNTIGSSSISLSNRLNTVDLGNVTAGDVFIATAQAEFNTSGANGTIELKLSKDSGTAYVAGIGVSNPNFKQCGYVEPNALNVPICVTGVFSVTKGGTLVMESYGQLKLGSTATAINHKLEIIWLKKQ